MTEPTAAGLQAAITALRIHDVYLRHSESYLADGFEPKYDPEVDALEVQFQHVVAASSVLEIDDDGTAAGRLFRVFIELGARMIAPEPSPPKPSTPTLSPPDPLPVPVSRATAHQEPVAVDDPRRVRALIAATMVAEYELISDPGAAALTAFARRNASYHVWPYWREFLAAQCVRMNLPKIILPAVQFARPPEPAPEPAASP